MFLSKSRVNSQNFLVGVHSGRSGLCLLDRLFQPEVEQLFT